jgi:hypothetical protein
MKSTQSLSVIGAALVFSVSLARGQEGPDPSARAAQIANWPAPAYWSPSAQPASVHEREAGVRPEAVEALSTSPLPFIGITPCRVVETRGAVGPYGGPALVGGGPARTFNIPAGPCPGIPSTAGAYSINVAAILPASDGFMTVFPTGAAQPTSSDLNFLGGKVIANAIVAPAGTGGAISIFVNVSTNMILDINGYYAPAGVGTSNTFLGLNAGNFTMTGDLNTGIGLNALHSNASGFYNTAIGFAALSSNTSGGSNTAIGNQALSSNTLGGENTAIGAGALPDNVTGNSNTAIGFEALDLNSGSNNIGIGVFAGGNQQTGSHDIYIGNAGVNGESNTIRIGDASFQDGGTIITGISGLGTIGGAPVYVNAGGRLGTSTSSSRRFKQDIRDIVGESERLMRLRPVAFRYKPEFDPTGVTQYGLIAEEVAEVYPDLVTSDRDGQPEGVRYHLITPLLLNEVQKQRRAAEAQEKTIEQQKETIDHQQAEIEGLKARLSRIEERLLADSRP